MPGDTGGSFESISDHATQIERHPGPVPDLGLLDGQTAILSLIDAFPGPAWLVDKADLVVAVNAPASTLRIQNAISDFAADIRRSGRPQSRRLALSAEQDSGQSMTLELTGLLIGPNERAISIVLGQDVTFERNLTAALVASRELYRDLMQCSGDFAWETNADGRFTFISVKNALGFDSNDLIGRTGSELLDPAHHLDGASPFLAVEPIEAADIWVRAASGDVVCMSVNALPMHDIDGSWTGARGVCRDVTIEKERQLALDRLAERERLIDSVIEAMRSAPEPTAMLSMAVRETAIAANAEVWLLRRGADSAWYAGAGPAHPAQPVEIEEVGARIESDSPDRTLEWRQGNRRMMARATRFGDTINGALLLVQNEDKSNFTPTAGPLVTALVGPLGVAVAQADQIEKLERLSATDELTGLMNRRAFAAEAARRLAMTRRQARSAVFLYLDLDHFKPINDILGHHMGDMVLRRLGQLLLRSSRSNDLAVRLGGDEFGLWLDATDMPGAVTKAEVLLQMIPAIAHDLPPEVPRLGVSIGLAAIGAGIESLEQILMRADSALYDVKRSGRGGWRIGPKPPEPVR